MENKVAVHDQKMIVVFGATGTIGKALVAHLRQNTKSLRSAIGKAGTEPTELVKSRNVITDISRIKPLSTLLTILLIVVVWTGFEGCASMDGSYTESLLSTAGFRTRTPSTPEQRALYSQFAPSKLERRIRNGKVLYTYADKQKDIVYIGGETEYRQYKRLALQQDEALPAGTSSIAETSLEAAQVNETASFHRGSAWGLWQPWW